MQGSPPLKILHVAQDLEMARVPPDAFHAIAPNVTVAWAPSPTGALDWLRENTDAAAIIVEVEAQTCATFLWDIHAARIETPVVIVDGSARLDAAIAALNAGAAGYVLAGPSLERELPYVVALAVDRATRRTCELTGLAAELAAERRQFARERRVCAALQQRSLELEATLIKRDEALIRSDKRRADEASAFADLLDTRHRAFSAQCARLSESRDTLAAELAAAMWAVEREREARTADADAAHALLSASMSEANARCAVLQDHLTLETQAHAGLEQAFSTLRAAYDEAERRHADESAAAAASVADLHARYTAALIEHADYRTAAEEELSDTLAVLRQSEDRANHVIAAAMTREAALIEELETESAAKAVAESHAAGARRAFARRRNRSLLVVSRYRRRMWGEKLDRESDLRRASAEAGRLRQSLDELQSAFHQLDELAGDHATARRHLEAVIAERDRQQADERLRHRAAERDAHDAMARLQADIEDLRHEMDATRTHAGGLREVADRVPQLLSELEKLRQEKRRQFERAPYGLCRCSADGTVIEANHSFAALLGYRRTEDLRDLSWLTEKERTGDLGWLLERAQATRKPETVETQWTTREGRRAIVRLQALVTSAGAVDIVAEDLTAIRALEAKLRQAQKMEAVGRLASEVAVTCDALLEDVVRETREWMVQADSVEPRIPAERMVEDVTRARGFLRRLGSYGDEQKRALEPVSAQRILRDLAPVLKRLVGERIALVLPRSAGVFPVDVDAERLERVLTNVAGYARERMPMGGQIKIDLATIAIGRRFAAGHSNVRAGDHVLITVTELPAARATECDSPPKARAAVATGMELGVLVELISSCGGHLWLEAQPAGNMVVKIHLPKSPVKEDDRVKRLPRWLRAASAANILF